MQQTIIPCKMHGHLIELPCDASDCPLYGDCLSEATKTNADSIRAMSDEELAKWLCSISTAECCDRSCPARNMCDLGDNGLIKWLKQPAEVKQ